MSRLSKFPSKYWRMLTGLYHFKGDMTPYELRFFNNMVEHLDPYNDEELSDAQKDFIKELFYRFCETEEE